MNDGDWTAYLVAFGPGIALGLALLALYLMGAL